MKLNPADFVPMDLFEGREPIKVDVVYKDANHPRNIFDTTLYHKEARLWLHKDFAAVIVLAARLLLWQSGKTWLMELKDGLRTTDVQAAMQETEISKNNPEWTNDPENLMLSAPGTGAHPRGMAIDIIPITRDGDIVPMGTAFDEMDPKSARSYSAFPPNILENRKILEQAVLDAAILLEQPVIGLPSEWWDFRYEASHYSQFAPLSDSDLPAQMQMHKIIETKIKDFPEGHFEKLAQDITSLINQHNDYL